MARLIVMGVGICATGVGIAIGTVFIQYWPICKQAALIVLATIALAAIPVTLIVFGISLFAGSWLLKKEDSNGKKITGKASERAEKEEEVFIEISDK